MRDIDRWWDGVAPRVLEEILAGQSTLARLAAVYLAAHARVEGLVVRPVVWRPSREQIIISTRVAGPVAFKEHMTLSGNADASVRTMADRLEGAGQRLVLEGDRGTTMGTVQQSPRIVGWRRIQGRPEPCPFCLMLISRGAVYSKETVRFRAHDWCACSAEPLYRREQEPETVRDLYRDWQQATRGETGAGAVRAWRRNIDAQRRPASAPQRTP